MTSMVRGYILRRELAFIETSFDAETRERVLSTLPSSLLELAATAKPAEWYPSEHSNKLLHAIVAAKNEERASSEDLISCGEFIASEATNTFLRILMKIMTPTLFLKKMPSFWLRDFTTGRWELDLSNAESGLIKMCLLGADDYDHISVSAVGYLSFGLATIGKPDAKITQKGWSFANPRPREVHYEVSWT